LPSQFWLDETRTHEQWLQEPLISLAYDQLSRRSKLIGDGGSLNSQHVTEQIRFSSPVPDRLQPCNALLDWVIIPMTAAIAVE
jgi:hypothetical protein